MAAAMMCWSPVIPECVRRGNPTRVSSLALEGFRQVHPAIEERDIFPPKAEETAIGIVFEVVGYLQIGSGNQLPPEVRRLMIAQEASFNFLYRRMRLFVELSCLSRGGDWLSSSGMMRWARALPSSTPHWSKELMFQMTP
jgi:hypothetical protein